MLTLGIESTCDETACSVVKEGKTILSNVIASQEAIHAEFGGVFPELASRHHVNIISSILDQALKEAKVTLEQIDLITVAARPGLIGSILVGLNFAKGLALGLGKPLIEVDHVKAHLFASTLNKEIAFPAVGLVISGGHTTLSLLNSFEDDQIIGQTQDDAIGEAFDKVARLLALPYPGGPHIEALAEKGDSNRYPLKAGQVKHRPFDFSFSGLKTGVLYLAKGQNSNKHSPILISEEEKKNVAASFQRAAFDDLIAKTKQAVLRHNAKSLLIGGGVSNSQTLRILFEKADLSCPIFWPPAGLSLDNGAMIAALGTHQYCLNN